MLETLRMLTSCAGVSGFEEEVSQMILKLGAFSSCRRDPMGNLICMKESDKTMPIIMLDAHMDEVGFIVKHIDDTGFLYLENLGKIDPRVLPGKKAIVRGSENLLGVFGDLPPHVKEKKDVFEISELPLDCGLTKNEIKSMVSIGDSVVFHNPLFKMGKNNICSKAIDNRAGCAVLCRFSHQIKTEFNLAFVFSSQEEIGARGARVATYALSPSLAISVDCTHGNIVDMASAKTRKLGSGPVIGIGPNIHPKISQKLKTDAKRIGIPHTVKAYSQATPTNLRETQLVLKGVSCGLVSIPTRYLHTPTEIADLRDIKYSLKLLVEFISTLNKKDVEDLSCF
ncbi:MAG: zinc-binding metallopeptidase family protein [Candidatus Methanofastidiosia archaeon]